MSTIRARSSSSIRAAVAIPNNLHWLVGGDQAEVRKVVKTSDGVYVLLHLGACHRGARDGHRGRPDLDNTIVASATAKTVSLPQPRVSLELKGYGKIDFVPTNRPAKIIVSSMGDAGKLVAAADRRRVQRAHRPRCAGDPRRGERRGLRALRLAYRVAELAGRSRDRGSRDRHRARPTSGARSRGAGGDRRHRVRGTSSHSSSSSAAARTTPSTGSSPVRSTGSRGPRATPVASCFIASA